MAVNVLQPVDGDSLWRIWIWLNMQGSRSEIFRLAQTNLRGKYEYSGALDPTSLEGAFITSHDLEANHELMEDDNWGPKIWVELFGN